MGGAFLGPETDSVSDPFFIGKGSIIPPGTPSGPPLDPPGVLQWPRWGARVDFTRFVDDLGVPKWDRKIPGGPKGPPKEPKNLRTERK